MAKLILELGINHNGNFQNAKKLIDQSAEIGCWGIKFQYRDLKKYLLKMNKGTELGKEIIDYEIKKNFITEKQIIQLAIYGKKLGLKCGISFFSERDVNNFPKKFFDFYKVPSPVSDNYKLIKKLKNLNKKPTALICHTIKGKGFHFAENNPYWHHKNFFTDEEVVKINKCLER